MRLMYVTSGAHSLSYLDPNIVEALTKIDKKDKSFQFKAFHTEDESFQNLYAQVVGFQPDVLISFRGTIPTHYLRSIKTLGIPIGVWVVDDPYNISGHLLKAKPYDFVITQESSCQALYRKYKKPCIHLPLAVNPKYYHPMRVSDQYKYDICFVGTALPVRVSMIDQMTPYLLKNKNFIIIGKHWERLNNYHLLKDHIQNAPIPPNEVVKYYNGAKIVLNIHRSRNDMNRNPYNLPANTPNNRTFDIAACKAFQLATYRAELSQYYKPDEEIACFSDVTELEKKITYYLKNNDIRKEMIKKAYKRTIQSHTYFVRMKELIIKLQEQVVKSEA